MPLPRDYKIETWTEYTLGQIFLILRFYARWKTVGFKKFGLDDLFCGLAMILASWGMGMSETLGHTGSTIGLTTETALQLTPEQRSRASTGAKMLFVTWFDYVSLIWSLKGVILVFYSRLTLGLWQNKFVKFMMAFAVVSWLACILTVLSLCTPIPKNWQVIPMPPDNCVVRKPMYIITATLNVLTDLGLLFIPMPMLFTARIPIRQKLILGVLFSLGIFSIITVIMRAVYSLQSINNIMTAAVWALRETLAMQIAVSAIAIKPLFSRMKWADSFRKKGSGSSGPSSSSPKDKPRGHCLPLHNKWSWSWSSNNSGNYSNSYNSYNYNANSKPIPTETAQEEKGIPIDWPLRDETRLQPPTPPPKPATYNVNKTPQSRPHQVHNNNNNNHFYPNTWDRGNNTNNNMAIRVVSEITTCDSRDQNSSSSLKVAAARPPTDEESQRQSGFWSWKGHHCRV